MGTNAASDAVVYGGGVTSTAAAPASRGEAARAGAAARAVVASTATASMRARRASVPLMLLGHRHDDGRTEVSALVLGLQRQPPAAARQRDVGAEGAPTRDRHEPEIDLLGAEARDVGCRRPARPVVAGRREGDPDATGAERRDGQVGRSVGRRPVVVVMAAVLLVVAEAGPLALASGSLCLPLEQVALACHVGQAPVE